MPILHFVDTVAIILGIFIALLYIRSRSHPPLPPGPRKLPIIGNALDMPTEFPSKGFADMGKKYSSDIIHLNVFGTKIVVLNSYEMAQELLEKRSAIYSSRPTSVMLSELGGYGYAFITLPYNSVWRTHRRLFTKYFHPTKAEIHQPREAEHVRVLLRKLHESPEKFLSHIRHMIGATSLSMVYGLKIKDEDDPYIDMIEAALKTAEEMVTPGAFLVDTFPLLKWIPAWVPGTRFHQVAKRSRKESEMITNMPYNASLSAQHAGTSFIFEGLADFQNGGSGNENQAQHIETLKQVGMMTNLGSIDTTYATLTTFMLLMMLYPEVQKNAQLELDKVLGGRLPVHEDIPAIPYMTALLLELLRWNATVSTGFPHSNTEEDIFNGYYIPKGSIIIPNQRAMLWNEKDYPNPDDFMPERFLKSGKLNSEVKNPEDIAFGFGRRICPGSHIAKSSLWLSMASILSTFNIGKPMDKEGNVCEPTYKLSNAGINHPGPFECSITPRSEKAVSLIESISGE